MIIHRMQTRPTPEPPVKFYKTIALSFLVITLTLLGIVIFTTTKKATITVMAKEDEKTVNLAVNIEKQKNNNQTISGSVSSTVFKFTQTYFPASTKMVDGTATGEIIIYNKSNTPQPLVKTTRFLTPNNLLFRLQDGVVVPANGQISAQVYADQPGKEGDIGPSQFIIPGLRSERQTTVYAESLKAMTGGLRQIKTLTNEDIAEAEKDLKIKITQAFLEQLKNTDEWHNQKAALVTGQEIKNNRRSGEEVTEFQLSSVSTIVYALYNEEELTDLIAKEIGNKIDSATEKIISTGRQPGVVLLSAVPADGTAQISVAQNVTVTLDANSERLAPENFYGQDKEEIERYLLALPHAAGAEIVISPKWSDSAPSISDKIKVIVKSIR